VPLYEFIDTTSASHKFPVTKLAPGERGAVINWAASTGYFATALGNSSVPISIRNYSSGSPVLLMANLSKCRDESIDLLYAQGEEVWESDYGEA